MENARTVIAEVTDNVTQHSSSKKDEIIVMKAIMNDPDFSVGVYDKSGKVGDYCPAKDMRKMATNIVAETTKIPVKEAKELVDMYEFTKADAACMINISKEFINTYLHTGRKLPLGGRINSDVELMWKEIEDRTTGIPIKGSDKRTDTFVPAHGGIKAINSCPSWIK